MGYFLAEREEWAQTDESWGSFKAGEVEAGYEVSEEDRITDKASYIQYGPNPEDVCRWTNCRVWAIPGPGEDWRTL